MNRNCSVFYLAERPFIVIYLFNSETNLSPGHNMQPTENSSDASYRKVLVFIKKHFVCNLPSPRNEHMKNKAKKNEIEHNTRCANKDVFFHQSAAGSLIRFTSGSLVAFAILL